MTFCLLYYPLCVASVVDNTVRVYTWTIVLSFFKSISFVNTHTLS